MKANHGSDDSVEISGPDGVSYHLPYEMISLIDG